MRPSLRKFLYNCRELRLLIFSFRCSCERCPALPAPFWILPRGQDRSLTDSRASATCIPPLSQFALSHPLRDLYPPLPCSRPSYQPTAGGSMPFPLHVISNIFKFVYLFCSGQFHYDVIPLILWTLLLLLCIVIVLRSL